ncbi:hypothetical protein J4438_00710 [Candidatus Woesearchaeota archaeon]|nr:hypothetical protein [Candidatus Woesearchaeota archaeon]
MDPNSKDVKPKFYYSDLCTLANEYESRVPPSIIKLILQHVELEDLAHARRVLDLYVSDEGIRNKVNDFKISLEGKLF